jgi:hypothetical protein
VLMRWPVKDGESLKRSKMWQYKLSEELMSRLLPAIRHKETGKLTIGKRGNYHSELLMKAHPKSGWTFSGALQPEELKALRDHDRGFYDPKAKKFLTRDEAGGIDSQELLNPRLSMFREEKKKKVKTFKQYLNEKGNPLARMHKFQEEGRHFVAVSTERPGLSKDEIASRNKELVASAREAGFGVRKAKGMYEGGSESSHVIHAKAPGREAGAELVAFGRKMGQKYGQDSILHHNGKSARLIGTNETGYPGMGKSEKVGEKLKYNRPEQPFQTELRPSKKKSPARFTTE